MSPTTKVPLAGYRFGKLTVMKRASGKTKYRIYECRCECGNKVNVPGVQLHAGQALSCGKCGTRGLNGTATKTSKTLPVAHASRRSTTRIGNRG